jgi:hypothetical protein
METMYFVLGMLSIIGVIAIATIVWGIVKISKLLKVIKQQEEWIINNERQIHDTLYRLREDLDRRMDIMDRYGCDRVTDLQRELDSRFNTIEREQEKIEEELHRRIGHENEDMMIEINSQITDAVTQSTSYTDKRIDKLIDTYFMVSEAKKQK